MTISILMPHYRVGKISAYSVAQILKYRGNHDVKLIVVDNSYPDDSIKYLEPFKDEITIVPNLSKRISSHGIAFDYVIEKGLVTTPYFITVENDSFPLETGWLDYYEEFVKHDFDAAGNVLALSGGTYFHPCGMLYKTSVWHEAKKYCDSIEYTYFPNMSMKENFACHLMVHRSLLAKFLDNPEDYIVLAQNYFPFSKETALERAAYYSATVGPFHNGMGSKPESVRTYGNRTFGSDVPQIILDNRQKLINRVGYEPGQWLCYWMFAMNKKVAAIPVKTKWMPNRVGQQQEYTLNEAGFKHLWAISSYTERGSKDVEDIYELKRRLPEELYETLPDEQKIQTLV